MLALNSRALQGAQVSAALGILSIAGCSGTAGSRPGPLSTDASVDGAVDGAALAPMDAGLEEMETPDGAAALDAAATRAIVVRHGPGLCLANPFPEVDGGLPCTMLAVQAPDAGGSCLEPVCDPGSALSRPPSDVLSTFCASQESLYMAVGGADSGAVNPATQSGCALRQLTPALDPGAFVGGTCASASPGGWCYVQDAGSCDQTIVFVQSPALDGTVTFLDCPVAEFQVDGG